MKIPGVVPFDGHYPKNKDEAALDYATFGPLTRYAEDLPLLMKIISGEAGESLKLDEEIDLKNLKVYTVEELSGWNFPRVEEEIKVSVRKAATYLGERCKSDISDYKFDFEEVFEICAAVIFSIKNIPTPWREKPEVREIVSCLRVKTKTFLFKERKMVLGRAGQGCFRKIGIHFQQFIFYVGCRWKRRHTEI